MGGTAAAWLPSEALRRSTACVWAHLSHLPPLGVCVPQAHLRRNTDADGTREDGARLAP